MKKMQMQMSLAVVMLIAVAAQAANWQIRDAGLQDATNFVVQGANSGSRSDIAGDPGTRFNITLTGSGWTDIQIGDSFDLPSNNAGIVSATGNNGDLSGNAAYTMTIRNPSDSIGFLATIYLNTGWTDSPWGETDRYYQDTSGWTWIGAGQDVTLVLDFDAAAYWTGSSWQTGQTVLNLNHVSNIGLKIGGTLGNVGEPGSDIAFNVDVVPEPATLSLLAIGGLALIRRHRKA